MTQKTNKKKILFIGRFPPPIHGAAIMNELYYNSIEINRKFNLDKISINNKGSFGDIGKINARNLLWFIKSYLKFLHRLVVFKPDLIYFELAPSGLAFYRDSLYILACKLFRKKILFQIHARNLQRNRYSKFIFKNTKIIILSELLKNEVGGLFKNEDIYFMPNGIPNSINDKKFSEIINKRNKIKKLNLIFLSNMIEEKGTLDVLKICRYLKNKKIKFRAIFAGSWPNRKTKEKWFSLRNKLGLKNHCTYVGEKYNEEKNEVLEQSHFMVFPTKYKNESFPLVVLEAFMFGVPVFAYDNGAIKEIVSKDFLGKIAEKGNLEALAKEIEKRAGKKLDYAKIRNHFKKKYVFNVAEKKLAKIFEEELK